MKTFRVGILYSTTGPYGAIGRDCRAGAEFAIEELEKAGGPLRIEPVFGDPAGQPERYLDLIRSMLRDDGCRNVIGTITSLSRKDVIPLVEKYDGLLWYICPYEGFEANENVIYTGACPNQHLIPLFDYMLPRYGKRIYLAGANYVWGWEMNRLARELLLRVGGEVLGERYLPIEEADVGLLIADLERHRPDFILNNMIGPSSYAFLAAVRRLADRDPAFAPERCPVLSCDLTECELGEIEPGVAVGQLSAASYFESLSSRENLAFKRSVASRFGAGRRVSSFFAGAYAAVKLCAEAVTDAERDDPASMRGFLHARPRQTVLGSLAIDPRTNHAALPFHLGRINEQSGFDVIASRGAIVADPYLVGTLASQHAPHLRAVQ
ncbi:transporter substrate-binding domain-containing protein [Mesorhizobium sp. WSM4884]|uniref:transporter substrate-binding domain-containing protein n=1 Tax=Mesorhizobium sp. WSM4884 TaxID=3038542 RepID=UPI002417A0A2|nr:transporter substrate-binding domain-containing protein [Mesorhizobium sp. WSM4884]MDG4882781.1 transporter substrate-binding domain-containing protein [Mesorhizobium sp. WSM4884]